MKKLLLIFVVINSSFILADSEYIYKWIQERDKPDSGKCYMVDSATLGKNFINKEKTELCKPDKTFYRFDHKKGSCYELGPLPDGLNYLNKVKTELCQTEILKIEYKIINNRAGCFEIDIPTEGKSYYKKLPNEKCESIEKDYRWLSESPYNGSCILIDSKNKKKKVGKSKCLPRETKFKFHRLGETRGSCFEISIKGEKFFSSKTSIEKCRANNLATLFVFLKEENALSGKCYEIDEKTKGDLYLAKVDNEKCI